jgi:hypothetical protein
MGAVAWSREAQARPPSRARWLPALLLLLLATLGPQLPQLGSAPTPRVAPPVSYGALGGDHAVVAALARPTGVAAARGDERPHLAVVAAAPVGGVPLPGLVAVGPVAQPSYDVLAGVPIAPTSRGPPVES